MKLLFTCRLFVLAATMFICFDLSAQTDSAVWTNVTKVPTGFGYPSNAFDSAGFSTSGLTTDTITLSKVGIAKTLKPKIATSPYDNATYSMREYGTTDTSGVAVAASLGIWEANPTSTSKPDRYLQFNATANKSLFITSVKASLVSSGGAAVTADFYYSTDGWATSNLLVLGSVQKLSKDTMHTFVLQLPNTLSLTSGQTFSLRMLPYNASKSGTSGKLLGFEDVVIYANPTALPVKFTNLNATLINNDQAKISWSCENAINLSNYVVEKSTDGVNFNDLEKIEATNSKDYSYTDLNPVDGINYYRIKSNDINGASLYSAVVTVLRQQESSSITVFPNPVTNKLLNLQINGIKSGNYAINIYSITGQKISSKLINITSNSFVQPLTLPSNIKPGVYQLEFTNGTTRIVRAISVR